RGHAWLAGLLLVEHYQHLAAQVGIALHHMHVAGEGRDLVLVAHFERSCLNLDRLVAVLGETLQRIWRAVALRTGVHGQPHQGGKRHGCNNSTRGSLSHCPPITLEPPTALASGITTMVTPRSNRMISPELINSMRLALIVPCCICTSTGRSVVTWPVRISTRVSSINAR